MGTAVSQIAVTWYLLFTYEVPGIYHNEAREARSSRLVLLGFPRGRKASSQIHMCELSRRIS